MTFFLHIKGDVKLIDILNSNRGKTDKFQRGLREIKTVGYEAVEDLSLKSKGEIISPKKKMIGK